MGKGMKFLFGFMLTFLTALCGIAGVIIFAHVGGDGNGDSHSSDAQLAPYTSDQNMVEESIEESDDAAPVHIAETDTRTWRARLERPEGSAVWHYYPVIPAGAMPGDTVVLSAVDNGFVDWEAVTDNVELTKQSSDEDLVRVSFVMPDEEVVIRALYDDEIMFSGTPTAHMAGIVPLSGGPPPYGMVGLAYNHNLDDGAGAEWSYSGALPPGLTLDPAGLISGTPGAITGTSQTFHFDATPSGGTPAAHSITIWASPTFENYHFLPGMVDMPYLSNSNSITARNIPNIPGVDWRWHAVTWEQPQSPDTLTVDNTYQITSPYSTTTISTIIGSPLTTASTPGTPFRFTVSLKATVASPRPELAIIDGAEIRSHVFNLTIYPRFEIITGELENGTFVPFLPADVPPGTLPDGMVGPPNQVPPEYLPRGYVDEPNDEVYEVWFALDPASVPAVHTDGITWTLELDPLPTVEHPTVGLPPVELPGLDTGPVTPGNMAYIRGIPFVPFDSPPPVVARLTTRDAANPNFNGPTEHEFTIRIWPRTYLRTSIPLAFVMRPGEVIDIGSPAHLRQRRRAIMPGNRGIIKVAAPFARWDVEDTLYIADVSNNTYVSNDTYSEVEIGGPINPDYPHIADPHAHHDLHDPLNPLRQRRWGRHVGRGGQPYSFVIIDMPTMDPVDSTNIDTNRDVTIGGVESAVLRISPPRFTSFIVDEWIDLPPFFVQNAETLVMITGTGLGPPFPYLQARWSIEGLPDGLSFYPPTGHVTTVEGRPTPIGIGDSEIIVRVTLPGTMRLDGAFTITIRDAQGAPSEPLNLRATPGNAQVTLSWDAPATGAPITRYEIEVNGVWRTVSPATATTYTVTGLTNGTAHTFRVRAVNAIGEGVPTAPIPATPSAPPPVATTRPLHTDLHGGTGGPNFPSVIPQTAWVIPTTPRPTRANHEFAGWSLTPPSPGGTATVVDRVPAATGAAAADPIVLHANWTMNFISVTDITVPATPIRPGETITLVDLALPRNATNRTIIWDMYNPGPTGATINTGNSYSFTAPREGTATIIATVINGTIEGGVLSNFTERFEIIVATDGTTPPGTPPGGATPPPGTTAPPAGVTRPTGAGNLEVIEHFGTWTGRGTRTARVSADHNTFERLWFGEHLVLPAHLTIASGSTSITLSEAFITNLSDGTYSFIAEFAGGHATLNLIVSRAFGAVPQTGVDITGTVIAMWASIIATVSLSISLYIYIKRKNKHSFFNSFHER